MKKKDLSVFCSTKFYSFTFCTIYITCTEGTNEHPYKTFLKIRPTIAFVKVGKVMFSSFMVKFNPSSFFVRLSVKEIKIACPYNVR